MEMFNLSKFIIDSHAHIFPEKIAEKASVNIGKFYDLKMDFDGSVKKLLEIGEKNGIDKFLVQSVATVPHQVSHINDFIAEQVSLYPDKFIGFASLNPDMDNPEEEIERVIKLGLKGIKLHPDFQHFAINEPKACRLYEAVGDKLPFLIHTGDSRYKYSNPPLMAEIAKKYPRVRFIAAHFGGWSEWDSAESCLCGLENVWVDSSSSFYEMPPERAVELIEKYGADRVFFGTDYPMWDAKDELEYIDKLPLNDNAKEKLLWKNISDFLQLGL